MIRRPKESPVPQVRVFGAGLGVLLNMGLVAVLDDEEDEAKELSRKAKHDDRRRRR
jgi:hypothetical protein